MSARSVVGLTVALLLSTAAAAPAAAVVPPGFRTLTPYQVVEQIMAQGVVLDLTDEQLARLDELGLAIRTEQHRFIHRGGKSHSTRHLPMVTRQQAYDRALAVLAADQQARLEGLFPPPEATKPATRKVIVPRGKP